MQLRCKDCPSGAHHDPAMRQLNPWPILAVLVILVPWVLAVIVWQWR
jgi:hypothetical protein